MSFYKKLCELGPRLIDDSRRKEESIALDDMIEFCGCLVVVREVIEYLCTTDAFFTEAIEDVLSERRTNRTLRATALAAAEMWMMQVQEHVYGLGYKTVGWRLNRKDKMAITLLTAALEHTCDETLDPNP